MRRRLRRYVVRFAPLVLAMCSTLACDRAVKVRPGMSESDVRNILGRPSWTETDKKEMEKFFFTDRREACISKAHKVLFYDYWISNDASISLDQAGRVLCVERAHFMIQ